MVAAVLAIVSFLLILPLNTLTKQLSVLAVIIAGTYPYFKRFFAIPQAYLGIAFGFGIPMAFAASPGHRAGRRLVVADRRMCSGPWPTTPNTPWSTATTT
jgi:4-hydroxybenzoate polyprenyltransferase